MTLQGGYKLFPIVTKYSQSGIPPEQEKHILDSLTDLSQTFIPNAGQVPTPAHFYTRGAGRLWLLLYSRGSKYGIHRTSGKANQIRPPSPTFSSG